MPQVVDYNLVFNQNSSYLVQMQLCYRWYTPKNRLIPIIGWGVSGNMVVTHNSSDIRTGGGGLSDTSLYHPCIRTQASLTRVGKGGVQHKEGINSVACLLRPSLPIRAKACGYLLAEFPDNPLGPLPARSYPGVNGRPSLVRNPSPPHPLIQGGVGYLGFEI